MTDGKDGNTKDQESVRDEIELGGYSFNRLAVVTDASMRFAASSAAINTAERWSHPDSAEWACDAAESIWAELCKRFPEVP